MPVCNFTNRGRPWAEARTYALVQNATDHGRKPARFYIALGVVLKAIEIFPLHSKLKLQSKLTVLHGR
jgi:hypothetical protein